MNSTHSQIYLPDSRNQAVLIHLKPLADPPRISFPSLPSRGNQYPKFGIYYSHTFFKNLFIYLLLAVLGLRCCAGAFSSCGERGPLFVAVHGLLIAVASLVAEHGL